MARLPNIHPGDVLREEFLEPLGMTTYRLAKELDMKQTAVGEILAGKRAVTPATALRLSRYFGNSAQFWLNLQAAYDLEEEEQRIAESLEKIQPRDLAETLEETQSRTARRHGGRLLS